MSASTGRPPHSSRAKRTPLAGIARHFEGWQPALLAVFLAGSTAAIAVPRPVDPLEIPEPRIDAGAVRRVERADAELADQADRVRLDVDVLELGTQMFAFGEADATGDDRALSLARTHVVDAAASALRVGAPAVLELRAHHLRTFLRELNRWEETGDESADLRGTGGGFLRALEQNGWIEGRQVQMDKGALSAAFKKRWNEITRLTGPPFEVTLDEQRTFYRFLLRHPVSHPAGVQPDGSTDPKRIVDTRYCLKKIDELAALDATYPAHLARGVVLFRQRRFPMAVEAFRSHLDLAPDGPYALRTQNYLLAALQRSRDEP